MAIQPDTKSKYLYAFCSAIMAACICFAYVQAVRADQYHMVYQAAEQMKLWRVADYYAGKAWDIFPMEKEPRSFMGRARIETGDVIGATEVLEDLTADYPYHMNGLINLAWAYRVQGEYAKAMECYRRVLEIKPDDEKARYGYAISYQSNLGITTHPLSCPTAP